MDVKVLVEYTIRDLVDDKTFEEKYNYDAKEALEDRLAEGNTIMDLSYGKSHIYGVRKIKA